MVARLFHIRTVGRCQRAHRFQPTQKRRRVCKYLQKYPDKRAPFQEISLSLLCIVRCTYTDILKRSAISLYSVDVKLDTLLRNIGITKERCIRILHTSKRGCQFILSILQEVQAYIEDKTGFGSLALFVCLNLKIINRTDRAVRGIKRNNYGKFSIFE